MDPIPLWPFPRLDLVKIQKHWSKCVLEDASQSLANGKGALRKKGRGAALLRVEHASESPAGLLEAQLAGLHPQGPGPAQQLTFLTSSQAMLLLLGQETFRDPLVTRLKTEVAKNTDSKSQTSLVQILAPPLMTVNDNYSLCSSFFIFKMGIVVVRYLLHSVVKRTEFIWTKHLEQHLFLCRDHMQVLTNKTFWFRWHCCLFYDPNLARNWQTCSGVWAPFSSRLSQGFAVRLKLANS